MCFRRRFAAVSAAAVLAFSAGCGLNTGERHPAPIPPSFGGRGYACVGEIPDHIGRYFRDELNEGQINGFVNCLQKSLTTFAQYTRGRDQTVYDPDEIRRFVEEYFFRERRISDGLMREFMVIKQTLIGGSANLITRAELAEAVAVLDDIRKEAVRLKPYMRILNPELADRENGDDLSDRLDGAYEALTVTVRTFTDRLKKSRQIYRYENLTNFLEEFRSFVDWRRLHGDKVKPAEAWVGLLRGFKSLAVSTREPDGIRPSEWTDLLQEMSKWYLAYLHYRTGVKDKEVDGVATPTPVLEGRGLQTLSRLANQLFGLTARAIEKNNGTLTYDQIMNVFIPAQQLEWIRSEIRPGSVRKAMEMLLSRVYGTWRPSKGAESSKVSGLKDEALAKIRADFGHWVDIQRRLEARYRGATPPILRKLLVTGDPDMDEFMKLKTTPMMRPLFSEYVTPGDALGLSGITLVPEADFNQAGLRNEFINLSRMNVIQMIVTLVFKGYAENSPGSTWQSGITSGELQQMYEDFRGLGEDFELVDPRNDNAGSRSFVEGNLFTYSSDGWRRADGLAGQLTFKEAMELVAFLYSGGQLAKRYYENVAQKCPAGSSSPLDVKRHPKLDRCCVYRHLPGEMDHMMVNFPRLREYYRSLSVRQRSNYMQILLNTSYSPKNSVSDYVEYSEFSTFAVVLHYAEAVMTRYDANLDGILDKAEIKSGAVAVFAGYIQKFAKDHLNQDLNDADAAKALLFILANKAIPAPNTSWSDWWGMAVMSVYEPSVSLDRMDLAQVFQLIIGLIMAEPPSDTPGISNAKSAAAESTPFRGTMPITVGQCAVRGR